MDESGNSSKSGGRWVLTKAVSDRENENEELTEKTRQIHTEIKARYGALKIHQALLKAGFSVSLERVQWLMKKADIRSVTVKKFRPQTSRGETISRENYLN